MPLISVLGRQRQVDYESEGSLAYISEFQDSHIRETLSQN